MEGFDPFVFFRSVLAMTMAAITILALVRGVRTWRSLPRRVKKRVLLVLARRDFTKDLLVIVLLSLILLALVALQLTR